MKVDRYVDPSEFDRWKQVAEDMGFLYVASGPLVRSSYKVRVNGTFSLFSDLLVSRLVSTTLPMSCEGIKPALGRRTF